VGPAASTRGRRRKDPGRGSGRNRADHHPIIPELNEKDLAELPEEVNTRSSFKAAETADEVLAVASNQATLRESGILFRRSSTGLCHGVNSVRRFFQTVYFDLSPTVFTAITE
jgi:hypothetical protein